MKKIELKQYCLLTELTKKKMIQEIPFNLCQFG